LFRKSGIRRKGGGATSPEVLRAHYMEVCLPWFAIYVKARHEKSIAIALEGKKHEAFVPIYRRLRKGSRQFDLPLFPGYVFCKLELSNTLPVLTTPGVFAIVGNGRSPQSIPEEEIGFVRQMVRSGLYPCPWPYLAAPGDQILLTAGPLRGLSGVIVDASNEKWLVVSVHLLRRSIAVKVDRDSVELKSVLALTG
jgi:transcriptional antiterminator NusG